MRVPGAKNELSGSPHRTRRRSAIVGLFAVIAVMAAALVVVTVMVLNAPRMADGAPVALSGCRVTPPASWRVSGGGAAVTIISPDGVLHVRIDTDPSAAAGDLPRSEKLASGATLRSASDDASVHGILELDGGEAVAVDASSGSSPISAYRPLIGALLETVVPDA